MITCQHAQHLFDSYLDGELSAALQTELHAHRLNCTACQNELALLEACGDVIAMDRREPEVSASFTDRVLLAQRGRGAPRPRRWRRIFWLAGSPMAAAASLAFMFMVVRPTGPAHRVKIAGAAVAMPGEIQPGMLAGRPHSEAELRELASTPQMSMKAFEDGLDQFVKGSSQMLERTQHGYQQLGLLWEMGVRNTHEKLAAAQLAQQKGTAAAPEREESEVDPSDPSYPGQPPAATDSASDSDGPVEAL